MPTIVRFSFLICSPYGLEEEAPVEMAWARLVVQFRRKFEVSAGPTVSVHNKVLINNIHTCICPVDLESPRSHLNG